MRAGSHLLIFHVWFLLSPALVIVCHPVMSLTLRVSCLPNPLTPVHHHHLPHQAKLSFTSVGLSSCFQWHWHVLKNHPSAFLRHCRCFRCSINANADVSGASDADSFPADLKGSMEEIKNHQRESLSSKELLKRLKRYGVSGILAYGLLNTAYYLTTFLLVWFYVAPASGKMGYFAAVQRFLKLMAMVWAGSQVTKLLRAGGALALAPFVDKGLSWFTVKYKFESQGKAFMAIVGFCFGIALMLFLTVTLLWA